MDGHLPVLGVGPVYVSVISLATVAGIVLSHFGLIPSYSFLPWAAMAAIGAVLAAAGVYIWYTAVLKQRVGESIENNRLVTDGMYAYVRNPIYSAIMFVNWGLLFMSGNMVLLVLAPTYWILMTAMMVATEEKWLLELYGDEYAEYCGRVNRCIPWFPRKGRDGSGHP